MTKTCVVCKKQPIPGDNSRSFHKFPDEQSNRKKWMEAVKIDKVRVNSTVCSDHFLPTHYHQTEGYTSRKRLLSDAVPQIISHGETLYSDTVHLEDTHQIINNVDCQVLQSNFRSNEPLKKVTAEMCNSIDMENCDSITHGNNSIDNDDVNPQDSCRDVVYDENCSKFDDIQKDLGNRKDLKRKKSIHSGAPAKKKLCFKDGFQRNYISREDFVSDEAWERFLKFTFIKNAQIKNARQQNNRKEQKIKTIKELIETLKKEKVLAVDEYLEGSLEHLKEVIQRMKEKKTVPYPSHLKNFARNLHYHSPAAYEMVRKSFLKCLPCVETLNSWNCSKNYKPGICEEIIDHVSSMVQTQEEKNKKLIFNITFDEIHIKKQAYYCNNSHQWKGLVDLGGQLGQEDITTSASIASRALVFMLVSVNGNFKTPVAYYFTNALSGDDKSVLLRDLLLKLDEKKITVVSVTFDGDESNQKACRSLGKFRRQ